MTFRERLSQLNRLQNSRMFKIVASCAAVLLYLGGLVAYGVVAAKHGGGPEAPAPGATGGAAVERPEGAVAEKGATTVAPTAIEESEAIVRSIASARGGFVLVLSAASIVLLAFLAITWLGLLLTYLALMVCAGLVVLPGAWVPGYRPYAVLLGGAVALAIAFTILMRLAQIALGGKGPVLAVARNVLAEAVRMKVSVVFIVLLILGLASLPGWLNPAEFLRYRVQVFLQYGTGGAFWVIAILTLAFSASTVAFDQRDRTIWQTMTKPVAPWQYILGKWLGVVTLNAVLLAVTGTAVFQFTEFLRSQPAAGEREAYEVRGGQLSEDRRILETQVLTARVAVEAEPPVLDPGVFEQNVEFRVEEEAKASGVRPPPDMVAKIRKDLRESWVQSYRSLAPGQNEMYVFSGLGEARDRKLPLTFRWRINSGSNAPDQIYRLSLAFSGDSPVVQPCGLGYFHSLQLFPSVVDAEGLVPVEIWNGDVYEGIPNPSSVSFPPGGLEISYVAAGFRSNFARVIFVLWVKLAFLAMVAICASTFLSFPVACLVAFGTFFCAESATFLSEALENYASVDDKNNVIWYAVIIRGIAVAVSGTFKVYADLRPTGRLVEGTLLPWRSVAGGVAAIAAATAVLYGAAVMILRRRELAVYSGH